MSASNCSVLLQQLLLLLQLLQLLVVSDCWYRQRDPEYIERRGGEVVLGSGCWFLCISLAVAFLASSP